MTARVALVLALCATPAFAQQPAMDIPFSDLSLGAVISARPIEADGKPGAEWLVTRFIFPVGAETIVLYPQSEHGVCISAPMEMAQGDSVADVDGDGIAERVRFDFLAQRVKVWPLPTCSKR